MTSELEASAERLLRHVATDRLPVDSGAVAQMKALIREAHAAGRQSLRGEQEALADEILGELEAEGPTAPGTVGALHDYLVGQPRDRKVILRKNTDGNGHSPLAAAWEAIYEPGDAAERVIVLGPVN